MNKAKEKKEEPKLEELEEQLEVEKEDIQVIKSVEKEELPEATKKIVIPGELITDQRKKVGSNVFLREGKIYSTSLGLLTESNDFISVIPLEGKYLPRINDIIVGIVINQTFNGYILDINSFKDSFISKEYIRYELKRGTIISARVNYVNELNDVELSDPRVFDKGEIVLISPVKIPRLIGKNGSMLNAIKEGTGSHLLVGRNGYIWIKGGNTELAIKTIKKIEQNAHLSNLTNSIIEFLNKEKK